MMIARAKRHRSASVGLWLTIVAAVLLLCTAAGLRYWWGQRAPGVAVGPGPRPARFNPPALGDNPFAAANQRADQPAQNNSTWPVFAQEISFGKAAEPAEAELSSGRDLVALKRPEGDVDDDVESTALSPDGNFLGVITKSRTISLWDIRTMKRQAVLEVPRSAGIWGFQKIVFSADGSLFAASDLQKICVFEAKSGRKIQELSDAESEWVPIIAFAADNETLISANGKGAVRVWDMKKGVAVRTFAEPMNLDVFSRGALAVSTDGKILAYAGKKELIVAEVATGKIMQSRPFEKKSLSMSFSPDAKHLAIGQEKSVDVLSLDNIKGKEIASYGTSLEPTYLTYSPSGNTLLAACEYGDVYLFNPKDEKQPFRYHIESSGFKKMTGPLLARNGKTLVSASKKTIRIWDFEAGPYERRLSQKRCWSVSGDGRGQTLAVVGEGGVTVYDWKTGAKKHELAGIDSSEICLDPTGRFLAHRREGPAEIYDLESKTSVNTGCFKPAQIKVLDIARAEDQPLAWSPDGKTLAGGEGRMVKLLEAGKRKILGEHRHNVLSLAYSADGKWLASGGSDGKVMVWDLSNSSKKWEFDAHEKGVKCLSFSADASQLASGGGKEDPSVSIWDLAAGREKLHWNLHAGTSSLMGQGVSGVVFSPDAKYLAVTRGVATVEIYEASTGKLYRTAPGHIENPFGSSERLVDLGAGKFASFEENQVLLWSWDRLLTTPLAMPTPARVRPAPAPPAFATLKQQYPFEQRVKQLAYSPDGTVLAMSAEKQILLLNPANGSVLQTLSLDGQEVGRVVFSPDGKTLAASSDDKAIRLFDVATGTMQKKLTGPEQGAEALTFALDGTMLVSGTSNWNHQELFFWDVQSGSVRQKFIKDNVKAARSLVAFPGGKVVAALCEGKVHLWDVKTLAITKTFEARENSEMLAVSADGKKLACCEYQNILGRDNSDAKIWVWDVDSGKVLVTIENSGTQTSMTFGPDGNTIFTLAGSGSSFEDLLEWDLTTGKLRSSLSHFHVSHNELFGSSKGVAAFAFSPDGRTLATYSKGLRFWNADDLWNEPLQKNMGGIISFGGEGKLKDGMLYVNVSVTGRVSAAVLDSIAGLPYPVSLTLKNSEFMNDTELARLKNAVNVKHLDLTGSVYLGDVGLKNLATLTGLETLKLDAARGTDIGIESLHSLRNLKKLYLFESGATTAGIAKLKKALPGVQVYE